MDISIAVALYLSQTLTAAMIIVLLLVWWRQHRMLSRTVIRWRWVFFILASIHMLFVAGHGLDLWRAYSKNTILRPLLPPHSRFLYNVLWRDTQTMLVGWVSGFVLYAVLNWFFLRRHQGAFLDREDALLICLTTVIVGWPGVLILLAAIFLLSVLGLILKILFRRKKLTDRIVITPYIIPAAILIIVFKDYLLNLTHLTVIRF